MNHKAAIMLTLPDYDRLKEAEAEADRLRRVGIEIAEDATKFRKELDVLKERIKNAEEMLRLNSACIDDPRYLQDAISRAKRALRGEA